MKKNVKPARGRPAGPPRDTRTIKVAPSLWQALSVVSLSRGGKLRRRLSVSDLIELLCLGDAEVAREARRAEEGRSDV